MWLLHFMLISISGLIAEFLFWSCFMLGVSDILAVLVFLFQLRVLVIAFELPALLISYESCRLALHCVELDMNADKAARPLTEASEHGTPHLYHSSPPQLNP